ncbi:hypothetical protein CKK33_03120 [Mucilaginibacter sp. MD40]|nr:hypothetical protein CKK33_03120 [Mucilaginibacter sp. MD40]
MRPQNIWHKGEPKLKTKPDGKKLTHSGCSFTASDADFNQFNEQVADVTAFLKDNYKHLQKLTQTIGIEYAVLDFGVGYDESKFVQSKYLPTDLLKLCAGLNISIELSIYAPSAEEA